MRASMLKQNAKITLGSSNEYSIAQPNYRYDSVKPKAEKPLSQSMAVLSIKELAQMKRDDSLSTISNNRKDNNYLSQSLHFARKSEGSNCKESQSSLKSIEKVNALRADKNDLLIQD